MYAASRQNEDQKSIYSWWLGSIKGNDVQESCGDAGFINLYFCQMAAGFPPLYDKTKKNLDTIEQCKNAERWIWYGSKNKNESAAKARGKRINTTVLARKFGQGSTSEVTN